VNTFQLRVLAIALGALSVSTAALADVELKAEEREDLGIRTELAQPVAASRHWPASAQVLDVTPLITALSELHAAETAAAVSRAEAQRSERLYNEDTNIARKALDAARAQAMADEARVRTARAQLLGSWGRGISSMSPSARAALVEDLLEGRASLVRADSLVPLPADVTAPTARVSTLDGREDRPADWLGVLPQASNATLGGAALLRVAASLPVGQLLQATLTETHASLKGLGVPAAAVIRWRGSEWVYEETATNHFARRAVEAGSRIEGRALIESDGKGTPKVVTVGARALLGAELGASESQNAGD